MNFERNVKHMTELFFHERTGPVFICGYLGSGELYEFSGGNVVDGPRRLSSSENDGILSGFFFAICYLMVPALFWGISMDA